MVLWHSPLPTAPSSRRTQWRELTLSQKLSFFRWWFYLTSLANILNAVVAFLDLARTKSHNPTMLGRNLVHNGANRLSHHSPQWPHNTVAHSAYQWLQQSIGSAAAIRWIVMIRYLSHNRNYYTLVLTLQRGVPRVFRFLVRRYCASLPSHPLPIPLAPTCGTCGTCA